MDTFDPFESPCIDFDSHTALAAPSCGSTSLDEPMTRTSASSAPLLAFDPFPGVPGLRFSSTTSTSSGFQPAVLAGGALPDTQLRTVDDVPFYVHRSVLQYASSNAFGGLLHNRDATIHVPESSTTLSIALQVIYGTLAFHLPDDAPLKTVEGAIDVLQKYSVPVEKFAAPNWPLFHLILSHAPHRPIDTYALAAHYGLEDLAVAVSAHLLAYDTSTLTDELSIKMGPRYVKRLFHLHQTRRDALRNIVMTPPAVHPPTRTCHPEAGEQQPLIQAWAFAAADMAWNVLPATSTYMLQSMFERAGKNIRCGECKDMLHARIQEVVEEWAAIPRTI